MLSPSSHVENEFIDLFQKLQHELSVAGTKHHHFILSPEILNVPHCCNIFQKYPKPLTQQGIVMLNVVRTGKTPVNGVRFSDSLFQWTLLLSTKNDSSTISCGTNSYTGCVYNNQTFLLPISSLTFQQTNIACTCTQCALHQLLICLQSKVK